MPTIPTTNALPLSFPEYEAFLDAGLAARITATLLSENTIGNPFRDIIDGIIEGADSDELDAAIAENDAEWEAIADEKDVEINDLKTELADAEDAANAAAEEAAQEAAHAERMFNQLDAARTQIETLKMQLAETEYARDFFERNNAA